MPWTASTGGFPDTPPLLDTLPSDLAHTRRQFQYQANEVLKEQNNVENVGRAIAVVVARDYWSHLYRSNVAAGPLRPRDTPLVCSFGTIFNWNGVYGRAAGEEGVSLGGPAIILEHAENGEGIGHIPRAD